MSAEKSAFGSRREEYGGQRRRWGRAGRSPRSVGLSAAFGVLLLVPWASPVRSATGPPDTGVDRRVALTFDDLPMTGGSACDASRVREVTERLTRFLESRSIPAAGLASPGRECITPRLLEETLGRWVETGAVIGNHTATHPDLNDVSIADYLADIERAQTRIEAAVATDGRWFRPPYLHSGDDAEKKAALDEYLAANGYRVAAVTVDNQEWVYAAVYADARARGSEALAAQVVDAYVAHLEDSMAFYERLSMAVFGREIPQVLLLHANGLNADHLGRVVDMLERRGYRFIGMQEALADPAFARADTYVGPRGLSWLQRWALEDGVRVPPEPREDAWVAEVFRASRTRDADDQAVGMSGARRVIAAASRAFSEAYVAGDTARIRQLYTPDAVLLPPEREVRGRDAIVRYFAPSPRGTTVAHAMTSDELRISEGVAVDVGTWRQTWRSDDGAESEAAGRYLVVWRRSEDGRWRIEFDVWHRPVDP